MIREVLRFLQNWEKKLKNNNDFDIIDTPLARASRS